MDKRLTKRLIALILSGGILLSSTGVYTALAASEEYTTSEYTSALVGSDETVTNAPETTVPSTSESATSGKTEAETTTETEAESTTVLAEKPALVPSTTVKNETTTLPPFVEEDTLVETPADNEEPDEPNWPGSGTEEDPFQINSAEELLGMNAKIADGNNYKYFKLTGDIYLDPTSIDLDNHVDNGMPGSLVSVIPGDASASNFFHLDGSGPDGNYTISFKSDSSSDVREMSAFKYFALSIFGYVNSNSAIKNVVFDGIKITNSSVNAQAAGIILKNDGEIINCQFKNITLNTSASTTTDDSFDVGSIRVYSGTACIVDNGSNGVIDNETTTEKTFAADRVTINTSRSYAGVLVAQNRGKIYKVRAKNITVHGDVMMSDCVGGLVGANLTQRSDNARGISFCEISKEAVKGGVKGADKIGYLVGYNTGRIHNSKVEGYFKSSVKATDSSFDILVTGATAAGGIAGENIGDIQSCSALNIGVYFKDTIDGSIYGGIVGRTTYGIRNCVATGSTAGNGNGSNVTRYIGGIVGYVSDDENFSVDNCYALVKIIDSKAPLGAIVGFNGDNSYRKNRIRNVFYSSIISSRPSPVSYGKAGIGDLTFETVYGVVNSKKSSIEVSNSNFDEFSGWGSAEIEMLGNFSGDKNQTSYYTLTLTDNSLTYNLNSQGKSDKTVINYDVNITLPVGADSEGTVLANEPMEFGILNLGAISVVNLGAGTKDDPCILATHADLNLLYHAPAGHFKVSDDLSATAYNSNPATFWGSVDFDNHQLTYSNGDKPLFKGIYGSRSDSLSHNSIEKHKSSPNDDDPGNGVVQNLSIQMSYMGSIPSLFGDICNATIKNTVVKLNGNSTITLIDGDSGLFAKSIYGNTYMYGCYVDGSSTSKIYADKDGISGFIGVIDAEKAIIDNCGANVLVFSNVTIGVKKSAVFVSTIKSLKGGFIQNCYASGGLINNNGEFDAASCNIFAGNIESYSSETNIWNCYYSPSHIYKNTNASGVTSGIKSGSYTGTLKPWSFQRYDINAEKYMDVTIKIVTTNDKDAVYIEMLNNIDRFTNEINASSSVDGYFNTFSSDETFKISGFIREGSLVVKDGYVVSATLPNSFSANKSVSIYAEHKATGLVNKLSVTNSSEFKMINGSYVIRTPMDLYYLSMHQKDLEGDKSKYLGASFILEPIDEDGNAIDAIDMTGISIEPIGDIANPFTGTFDGAGYTIENLSFNTESNADQALFGYINGAKDDDGVTIKNLTLEKANIVGRTDTAALVGTVQDGATIENCTVSNSTIVGESHVGAIVGAVRQKDVSSAETIISGCIVVDSTITSTKKERDFAYVGGIVGGVGASKTDTCYATISGCKISVDSLMFTSISAAGYGIGGIVGYAYNNQNTIKSCTVEFANINCSGSNGVTYAALGGIAGLFGGSLIDTCTVKGCEITGECASGVVGHLINETEVSTVSDCTVTGTTNITAPDIAGGILAQISSFANDNCSGDKIIDNCKVDVKTTVESLAAGGIVGNIQQFSNKKLTISDSTNLGIIKTTGKKGSVTDAAGGIIGRLQSGQDTSGIKVTGCLSQGTISGNANLGGIIGLSNANAHVGAEKLIQKSYVTTAFSSTNLAVVKGLAIGFVGYAARNGSANLASEVVYSSLNTREHLFGNIEETSGGKDLNKGEDGTSGLLVDFTTTVTDTSERNSRFPYYAKSIVNYKNGLMGNTNVVTLKTNWYVGSNTFEGCGDPASCAYGKDANGNDIIYTYQSGEETKLSALTVDTIPTFSVSNQPKERTGLLRNFRYPTNKDKDTVIFTTDASSEKVVIGSAAKEGGWSKEHNTFEKLTIQTFDKKCQATVETTLAGRVNNVNVTFNVGFTVIVDGNHLFDGKGRETDPFLIYTAEDLLSIKQHHDNPKKNDTFKDPYYSSPERYYQAYYMVMNDIDLTEELAGKSFAPIGTKDAPFKGTISTYGNVQYKISGLRIENPEKSDDYAYSKSYTKNEGTDDATVVYSDALGLFGYTDGAKIYNLELENVQIESTPNGTNGHLGMRTGALVGEAVNTTIENVKVTGTSVINVEGTYNDPNMSGVGGIVGKAGNNVVLTNVAFSGIDNTSTGVNGNYYVGGIVGTSGNTTGCSITNAVVENAYVTNYANSGTSVAGGIAGQYSGSIVGVEGEETVFEEKEIVDAEGNPVKDPETGEVKTEKIEKVVTVQRYAEVKNAIVTGMVAGGIVGTGNIDKSATGDTTYDLNIELAKVTRSEVKAYELSADDSNKPPNCVAGGILGKSCDSYGHMITDSIVDADTTVTSEFCAGGIVGRAENHGGLRGQRNNTLIITGCSTLAKVTQSYAGDFKISTGKEVAGAGAVIGVIGALDKSTNVMNGATSEPQIQIKNVTAGGEVKGTYNVGGIVGQFASTQPNLHKLIGALVYDCVVSAKIDTTPKRAGEKPTERAGIIFGSIEGNQKLSDAVIQENDYEKKSAPFPETDKNGQMIQYASRIVDKVFYSSYMTGTHSLYGISAVNSYQGKSETAGKFSAAESLSVYNDKKAGVISSIYDVNQLRYNYPTGKKENNVEKRIEIPLSIVKVNDKDNGTAQVQYFGIEDYVFEKSFKELLAAQGGGDNTPFGFTIGEKEFVLAENGIHSKTGTVYDVLVNNGEVVNDTQKYPYVIQYKKEVPIGQDDLVFTYTNGLEIGITVTAGAKVEGDGTAETPFEVPDATTLGIMVPILASNGTYHFRQTADITFTEADLIIDITEFTGSYDGGNFSVTNYNLSTESSNVPVGMFGKVSGVHYKYECETNEDGSVKTDDKGNPVYKKDDEGNEIIATDENGNQIIIPNIQNLKLIDCKVTSGDTTAGTGVVAGEVTNGATISDVTVENCTVKNNVGNIGGIAGIVTGSSKLESVTVAGVGKTDGEETGNEETGVTEITTAKGSAGGIVGIMPDNTSTIIAPVVKNTIITSGEIATNGEKEVFNGGVAEDIAGGIVAQAYGTITGKLSADGKTYVNSVEGVTVRAFVSGGAVGAVYRTNTAETADERNLTLKDIRVADTDVTAKSVKTNSTAISAAGLLGFARGKTDVTTTVKLNNCYVDKDSTVTSIGISHAAGAVAHVDKFVTELDLIDTETYAKVKAEEADEDDTIYVASLVAYIDESLSKVLMNGCVAGGEVTGKAMKTFVAGAIGGFDTENTTLLTEPLFINGVISATLNTVDGTTTSMDKAVHTVGKFIAKHFKEVEVEGEDGSTTTVKKTAVFDKDSFQTYFSGNYYSSYPQQTSFFAPGSDDFESLIVWKDETAGTFGFKDVNVAGNLVLSSDEETWNNAAIAQELGSPTTLYAKFDEKIGIIYYGSKDNFRTSSASDSFKVIPETDPCIALDQDSVEKVDNKDYYSFSVIPDKHGAVELVAEYNCGLATKATIISIDIRGAGTQESPFLVGTPSELAVVRYLTTSYYRQYKDVNLEASYDGSSKDIDEWINDNNGKGYIPIGTASSAFKGHYDGQGFRITGLKINRHEEEYVGLFGYVKGDSSSTSKPVIKNIHLELMESDGKSANGVVGKKYVGGIAGAVENALIENCSVVIGSVTGENYVGGIVGHFTTSEIKNCFTQSDVNAFGDKGPYAGGIVGYISDSDTNSYVSGCFASGSIYATTATTSGDASHAAGIISYVANSRGLKVENCLFTGTTASGLGILGGASASIQSLSMNGCIDAGQNVAMSNNEFTKILTAVAYSTTLNYLHNNNKLINVFYDKSLLKVDTVSYPDSKTGVTGKTTSELIRMKMGEGWTSEENHYPVPVVSTNISRITYKEFLNNSDGKPKPVISEKSENTETLDVDTYSQAYAKFLSAPVYVDKNECSEIKLPDGEINPDYGDGLVYPVTLLTEIGGATINYSSSVFDTTDKGTYPEDFDKDLYGIKTQKVVLDEEGKEVTDKEGNKLYEEVINKNTDLLFGAEKKDGELTGKTVVYRNIFDTTENVGIREKALRLVDANADYSKNTRVNDSAASGSVFENGEAYYNAQVPVVYATATINGVDVCRDIKIPLSYGKVYSIATQRQLYALGDSETNLADNDKFKNYYGSTNDYILITDMDCSDVTITFSPIGHDPENKTYGYSGRFNGSGKTITGLTIRTPAGTDRVGMFSKITRDPNNGVVNPEVKNLTLQNATVEAKANQNGDHGNDVGTLVGLIGSGSVTIENCKVIGTVEYERDEETGEILTDENGEPIVKEYNGSVTGGGSNVGGLIGRVEYAWSTSEFISPPKIIGCSSTVKVSGSKDAVGGLIGQSAAEITSCYATGNVICNELPGGENNVYGVGGLIGIVSNGSVEESFASGNVEVKSFVEKKDKTKQTALMTGEIGVGGFVGYVKARVVYNEDGTPADINKDKNPAITNCFSGGNVKFGTEKDWYSNINADSKTAFTLFGIGGFSGINYDRITQVYSSAVVKANFGTITDNDGKHGVGIGGVAGIAFDNVKDVYSSGSVIHAYTSRTGYKEESYYDAGGTIGIDNAESTFCYYDSWTNNDPNLTSIGNKADDNDKNFIKSYTTEALTKGEPPETGAFAGNAWGFTPNAYPYLKDLLNENVDNYIKANAILSVVCVNIEKDDVSAKEQLGITQALTVPKTFTYKDGKVERTYNLLWTGATLEGDKAAVNRTRNTQETVEILAQVEGLEDYAIRTYSRACADMRGTFKQPYLIGRADDLAHMNMSQDVFDAAQSEFPEYYGQWATPIDGMGNPIDADGNPITESDKTAGVVHYQLMSNVDASTLTNGISEASASYIINGNTINYNGFMLKGNGYAIKNNNNEPKLTKGCFFENVNEKSMITNIIFDGLIFEEGSSAVVGKNNGTLQDVYVRASLSGSENVAGLVLENNGKIDGCVVDATITNAAKNVGVMVVTNNGTITNSATAGTIKTVTGTDSTASHIGAFVVTNKGNINNSFSMADIDVQSVNAEYISGFASVNDGGTIDSVYTRSAISFAEEPANKPLTIGSLVGEVKNVNDAEHIKNSYAAGLLGYFNEGQDSILFGTVGDMPKLSSVYVDKSLAGEASADSYKYSASLSSLMSMEYMQDMVHDGMNVTEGFVTNAKNNVLPQHATIINSVNDRIVDDDGNVMYVDTENPDVTYTLKQVQVKDEDENGEENGEENFVNVDKFVTVEDGKVVEYPAGPGNKSILNEDGSTKVSEENLKTLYAYYLEGDGKRIIRNYDALKAYSKVSTMTIKTGQSQYIDRLIPSSSNVLNSSGVLNSTVSSAENIEFTTEINGFNVISFRSTTSGTTMSTGAAGKETVIAQYKKVDDVQGIKLLRELVINPQLRIDVAVSNAAARELNPNFSGGMGTKESPYIIKGAASVTSLHYYGTEENLYFVLGEDIDMSGIDDFQIHHFKAHLNDTDSTDYQHTIENFTSTTGYGGLFGKIENGAVVNNVALTGKVIGNEQYTGALANIIEGKVTNCVVAADVTSTYIATETQGSATGVLAGRVTNGAKISNIVTTGRAVSTDTAVEEGAAKATNVAGGVIGSAQNAEMSNFLSTAYVETVKDKVLAGGIVGEMVAGAITDADGEVTGEKTTLTNAVFGGFADGYAVDPNAENKVYNIYPIVAKQSVTEQGVVEITNARFDKQANNKTMVEGTVGTGLRTKECEKLVETTFKNTSFNNSLGNGFYPVPITANGSDSFNATLSLAAATMNFYIGSSSGEKGLYTSMQFVNTVSGYGIECKEISGGNYFDIGVEEGQPYYSVKTKTYNEEIDPEPSIELTLVKDKVNNGAVRIVVPGLARNANIVYTIENNSDFVAKEGQLLGVLLRSVAENSTNVLNDFTSEDEIGKAQEGIVLAIAQGMDGFYVGEMLPSGYKFTVSGTINDTITLNTDTVKDVYGTKVILPTIEPDDDGNVRTDVKLTLTITKEKETWGVNSIFNTLWHPDTLN